MEILKAETTSATIVKSKLEAESLINKTFSELEFLQIEQNALQRQLEIKRSMFEEKMERIMLGDALLANFELNSLRLDDAITKVKQKKLVLEEEERIIQK